MTAPCWQWDEDRLVCQHPRGPRAQLIPFGPDHSRWVVVTSRPGVTAHQGEYSGEDFRTAVERAETWVREEGEKP